MQVNSLIGKKIDQRQGFLEDGTRVPLSIIIVGENVVSQIKTIDHEGYQALQLGFGSTKKTNKPTNGHLKRAGLDTKKPRFFREVKVDDVADVTLGASIPVAEVFEPGDIVDVVGTSKGKGYAGVVKRHGFHGGPRTHGQSDRERAPGSSGQTTTPGRVYRGKRMAGRMGNERVTVKNLEILEVREDSILVKGLIPGSKGGIVVITKVGKKNKKFMPLWSDKPKTEETEKIPETTDVQTANETVTTPEEKVETPEEKIETAKDTVETAEEIVKTEGAVLAEDKKVEPTSEESKVVDSDEPKEEENASK